MLFGDSLSPPSVVPPAAQEIKAAFKSVKAARMHASFSSINFYNFIFSDIKVSVRVSLLFLAGIGYGYRNFGNFRNFRKRILLSFG